MKSSKHEHQSLKICEYCKNNKEVYIPAEIIEACIKGDLVIFAGAGISTESHLVFPFSLSEDIEGEINLKKRGSLSFPELMTKYCDFKKGKTQLLQKIRERIEYVKSFPELYGITTSFHRELSTIYPIKEIITTNWDDFFEKECGAIPIVTPDDFAFWNTPDRKVFKIHGSINNLGSIIATEKDYKRCYRILQNGIIGSSLKLMLATKVVIFLGYSFKDYDFNKIYSFLAREMKDILPHSYIVNPNVSIKKGNQHLNSTIINTDATYFLKILKQKLVEKKVLISDERISGVFYILMKVKANHSRFLKAVDMKKKPEAIINSCYQEGLIHAFERMLARMNTGCYSHDHTTIHAIHEYDEMKQQKIKSKKYGDVAYIEGYTNGLIYLLASDQERKNIPLYLIFGAKEDISSLSKYIKLSGKASSLDRASYKWAKEAANKLDDGITYYHTAFLL